MMLDPIIAWAIRLSLSVLLLSAAWHKLSDRRRFAATVRAHSLLPSTIAPGFSRLLPFVEIAVALMLLTLPTAKPVAIATASLLGVYTLALVINLARGRRDIDCGCFASSAKVPLGPSLIARNLALLTAALTLLVPVQSRALLWIDWLTLGTCSMTLALLWAAMQHLARTGPALRRLRGVR